MQNYFRDDNVNRNAEGTKHCGQRKTDKTLNNKKLKIFGLGFSKTLTKW